MDVKRPAFLENYDRPTNQQTDMRVQVSDGVSTSLFPRGNKDNLSIIKVLRFLHNTIIIASEEEEEVEEMEGGGRKMEEYITH